MIQNQIKHFAIDDNNLNIKPPSIGEVFLDHEAMELAIRYAYKACGDVAPNPMVGAVLLDQNKKFLAVGYHQKYCLLYTSPSPRDRG